MELQNLNNLFSIFGSFLVFDDDVMPRINNVYSDCNISINQEPNNPQNKSGKLMKIVNPNEHYNITLRPNRIDIQFPGVKPGKIVEILQKMQSVFKEVSDILENPLGNRLAYVTSYFTFDDEGAKMQELINRISFLPKNSRTTELALRTNTPASIQDEDVNVVTNINNVLIGNNNNPQAGKRKSLMITFDINTLHNNSENRFDFNYVLAYFDEMVNIVVDQLNSFENI